MNCVLTGEEAFSIWHSGAVDDALTKKALIDDLVERYGPLLIAS